MKQLLISIFTLILGITVGSGQSLSLQQTSDGDPLFNGDEIILSSSSAEDEIECHLFVRNNGEFAIDVKVKKIHLSILENTANNICWGDACLPPTAFESSPEAILAGEITDSLFFSGHYFPYGNSGTTRVMYVFFDENNPVDSVGVIVNFKAGETGIDDQILNQIKFSDPYPNPATDLIQFDYSLLAEIDEARLSIFSLTGTKVAEELIHNKHGKLKFNTADIRGGYYFYSLVIENESVLGGKILIVR